MHFFRVPLRDIALPGSAVRQAVARTLGADRTVSGLTAGYLGQLAASPGLHDGAAARLLAAPSMELIRAVIAAEADRPGLAASPCTRHSASASSATCRRTWPTAT